MTARSRNEIIHDSIANAAERLCTLMGDGSSVVILACWPTGRSEVESDQVNLGNYFAQEGMVREWLARRERNRDMGVPPPQPQDDQPEEEL